MKNKLILLSILLLFTVPALCQNALTDGLIAYYPFNGNANDSTGNGSNGAVFGAQSVADRFGNPHSAYSFNSSNGDFISYIAGPKFKPTTFPISITAWVKSNTTSIGWIFSNDYSDEYESGTLLQIDDINGPGIVSASYCNGGGYHPSSRQTDEGVVSVNDNQWHFIAAVISGPQDMDIYIDCAYDRNVYGGSGGTLAYVGANGMSGVHYTGLIDDIRFYHRGLTLTDLQEIYSYPQPYDGLSLQLPADTTLCNGEQFSLVPVTTGAIQSYVWSDGSNTNSIQPTQGGNYSLQVYNGCSYAYDSMNVTFLNCTGVKQVNPNSPFSMSYSPESNSIQIQNIVPGQGDFSINLYNTLGQKITPTLTVKNEYQYSYSLPENLSSGIYFVNARIGNQNKTLPVASYR